VNIPLYCSIMVICRTNYFVLVQKSTTPTSQMSEEESSVKSVDWECKLNEKEREWREKEKTYVADLLKLTKELQEALAVTEGKSFCLNYICIALQIY